MKIRIGLGFGPTIGPHEFTDAVELIERVGVDSLWLPELVHSHQVDPFVGMAHALSRTDHLKVGTGVAVLPGRHPVLVAKQLTSMAGLAPGRVLPVFGLRPARRAERDLFPVPEGRRAAVFDESLRLLRLLLDGGTTSFEGEFFTVEEAFVGPPPSKPLDIWLGGSAPAALRRVGRFADGWLASFLTPDEARQGRETIEAAATEAGREIEDDHYGINLTVADEGVPDELAATIRRRRPDIDPSALVASSWPEARRLIERYIDAGLSKFVVRPASSTTAFPSFVDEFTAELMPMQN